MTTPPPTSRRWPRRLAIAAAVGGVVLGLAYWELGREATLQALLDRVASASGGSVVFKGVSGSLYGHMHIGHVDVRNPQRTVVIDNVDIDWSPWQIFSSGVAVSKLHVASVRVHTLREGEPSAMPDSLAPPITLAIRSAQVDQLVLTSAVPGSAPVEIHALHLGLDGSSSGWKLRDARADTAWGKVTAAGTLGAQWPFKLDATAAVVHPEAQAKAHASGDLANTVIEVEGSAGTASATGRLALVPFDPAPLRALDLQGKDLTLSSLPGARLTVQLAARSSAQRVLSGKVSVANISPAGTLDQHKLPLLTASGTLAGTLEAPHIDAILLDLGEAGKLTGSATMAGAALHTDRLDLHGLYGSLKPTRIAGDIKYDKAGAAHRFGARLADGALRADAQATLTGQHLVLEEARLAQGSGSLKLKGDMQLDGTRAFHASASAAHFNPSAFGSYPVADIQAQADASGTLAQPWTAAASVQLSPSKLMGQPLSGNASFKADAHHISAINAAFALGQNTLQASGSFGAPGEQLVWKVDGKQLSALSKELHGTVAASGTASGSMDAPRTTFNVDARGLGRLANDSVVQATGEAWLQDRHVQFKTSGSMQRLNPAALGAYLPGSVNGSFDGAARLGADWNASANVTLLQTSTLASAPFWGYAKLAADARHLSSADLDLHAGPNIVNAKGAFGAAGDQLAWQVDAPQLAAMGTEFGGALRGAGTLGGTVDAPAFTGTLDGKAMKLFGQHQLASLHASASLGPEALVSDIELTGYASPAARVSAARMQTTGTRAAHTLHLSVRNDDMDFAGELAGAWSNGGWTGNIAALQNKGRYAFTLAAPASLRVAGTSLAHPEQIALSSAVLRLPQGSISLQSLEKNGAHWRSKGEAAGVPLNYLAQGSEGMRDNVSGDLALGAQWELDLQAAPAGGAPALAGMLHVFREKGDLTVGSEVPVVLGLRTLDLRADVTNGALRTQLDLDGTRAGRAHVDATAQLIDGLVANASPLKLSASADMNSIAWLAPLSGQPALELDGALKLSLSGAGTIGQPTLNGNVSGEALALRWADQGVKLRNGQLRARLEGDQLVLERLGFDGVEGRAVAEGAIRFSGGEATMNLKLSADKLEVLSRPDRTVVLSGQSTLVRDARHFALDGKFRADRALIELAPQDRPTMSDDVIIIGKTAPPPAKSAAGMPLTVDLEADLGDDFRLRGMGIDADLSGSVRIRSSGARSPRVNGSIRVVSGTYRAYGQNLAIERGVLTFSGPYDNPALNILALRKRPEGEQLSETNVEAGVQVRGTAMAPVAKLVSTPTVTDSEKLAWLVLGHGMEGTSGNEVGVLSAAAGALLGGPGGGLQSRLTTALGVDEVGLSQAKGLESTVVTVGKRISSRAYLSFEQGATTASSLVKLRYKLNPRVTLQFQTGTNTALDVLYSWAFD